MPKFVVTKTFELVVKADTMEKAKSMAESFLELRQTALITSDIIGEEINVKPYVEPIEVAYTGWETLIRQGIDEWKFEYEIGSLEVYVDGDLYHLREPISSYDKFVEHSKTFVKENPNA